MRTDGNGMLTIPGSMTDARIRFPGGSLAFPDVDYSTQRCRRRFGPLTETGVAAFPLPVMPEGAELSAIIEGKTVASWPATEVGPAIIYPLDQPPTLVGSGLTPETEHCIALLPAEE